MVVEVGDQFLDHDAKPRQLFVAKPLRAAERPRGVGCLGHRLAPPHPAGQAIQIGVARAHRIRYVTLPKRLGDLSCFACPGSLVLSPL